MMEPRSSDSAQRKRFIMKQHQARRPLRKGKKLSGMLKAVSDAFSTPEITIGELKETFSGRTYGVLLLILALPNLLPIPAPGLSAVLGAPLILVTFQLMLGMKTPWFPRFIAKRRIKRESIKRVCTRMARYMEKLEFIFKPRLEFLTHAPAERFIALICVVLSLMIAMPVPFGNALPALAICLFAMGILQRDGLFILFGLIATLASATAIYMFLDVLLLSIEKIVDI